MAFWDFLTGSKDKTQQIQRFNPQQQQALSQLLSMGLGGLQNLQQFNFEPIAQQAREQFQQQTLPSIAERFNSMGGGRLSSPSFAQQVGQSAGNFQTGLAALESQYKLQQQGLQQDLLKNLLNFGLSPQVDSIFRPGGSGLFGQVAQGAGASIPLLLRLLGGI